MSDTSPNQTPEPVLYDADATQQFTFRQVDEDGEFETTHTYGPLTDNALVEYDELRSVTMGKAEAKGETKVATSALSASETLFDRVCERVDGYGDPGEEPPADWKEHITPDEKLQGVNTLLVCEVVEPERAGGNKQARRQWGVGRSGRTIPLRAYFDGREVLTSHTLPPKNAKHVEAYEAIRNVIHLKKSQRLNQADMKIPAQMEAKGALYDLMGVRATGYRGRVPLHHKAVIITEYFDSGSEVITKK